MKPAHKGLALWVVCVVAAPALVVTWREWAAGIEWVTGWTGDGMLGAAAFVAFLVAFVLAFIGGARGWFE